MNRFLFFFNKHDLTDQTLFIGKQQSKKKLLAISLEQNTRSHTELHISAHSVDYGLIITIYNGLLKEYKLKVTSSCSQKL